MTARRLSLSGKILLLALGNVVLLGAAALVFFRLQLGSGESMLLGPASDKMMVIVSRMIRQFDVTPAAEWDGLLSRLGEELRVRAYLSNPGGERIAGAAAPLPPEVRERMRHDRPPGPFAHKQGPPPPRHKKGFGRPPPPVFLVVAGNPSRYWIGGRLPVPDADDGGMLVLEADSMFNEHLFFDLRLAGSVGLAVAVLSCLCWFSFVRNLTRSIRQLDLATSRVAEGRFDVQVPVDRGDELGNLGSQISRMAGRLSTLVNGQKRFLGDIAHELCAPISRMQMALGILEQRAGERGGESLEDLREEVEHISGLVNELLQFSRAAIRPGAVNVEALSVADAVRRAVAREEMPGSKIEVAVDPALRVLANEVCFTRSVANLVRNSIRYAGHAGPIEISAQPAGREIAIVVADSGPGVDEDELERIFEPFYRREESRSRESGGVGLGLAIVKSGIESCHGSVACRNRHPNGLEVTIRLPAVLRP